MTPDIRDAERLQGFAPNWTKPAESVARASFRWSLLGNAVSKPVATWIGRRLNRPGQYETSRDGGAFPLNAWPRAARLVGKERRQVRISDYPAWRRRASLHEFLQYEPKLLSVRATSGFLSRIDKSSLRFVPGFKERVRSHLVHVREIDEFLGKSLLAAE